MGKYTFVVSKTCPVCGESTRVVKTKSKLLKESMDEDFCIHYKDFNPYFYTIWFCEHCGFAAEERTFLAPMPKRHKQIIQDFLSKRQMNLSFQEERTVPDAVASFKLAIFYAQLLHQSYERQAGLMLELAWVYRSSGERDKEEKAQDLIVRYIREQCDANGAVTTAPFTWHWSLGYTADPAEQTRYEGEVAARLASTPEEGHTYVICHEAERMTMGRKAVSNGFEAVPCEFHGNILAGPLNPEVQRFTVHLQEDGGVVMVNAEGLYLTCTPGKSLELTEEMAEDGGSVWRLMPDNGGYGFACRRQNLNESGILEIYANQIQTYHYKNSGFAIFNFYEVEAE